jgi:hypothetical protein
VCPSHGLDTTRLGWGSGELDGGGTYVSLVDPTTGDLTIVIETGGSTLGAFCNGNCNGHCNYGPATAPQNATFTIAPDTGHLAVPSTVVMWRTRLGPYTSNTSAWFERVGELSVSPDGAVDVLLEPDTVVTLTTTHLGNKGAVSIPPSAPFPTPYSCDFDDVTPPHQAPLWSDMEGGFEVAVDSRNPKNHVLQNHAKRPACCSFIPALDGPVPLTIIGASTLQDVIVEVVLNIDASADSWGAVAVRAQYAAARCVYCIPAPEPMHTSIFRHTTCSTPVSQFFSPRTRSSEWVVPRS